MCGLAGILNFKGQFSNDRTKDWLLEMGNQLAHRGPDDKNIYIDENIGLIFNRLSIIDLRNGAQPLVNENNTVILMVNGEIYNHKELKDRLKGNHHFKSHSDCEVILHLYEEKGIEFLNYLNGMFALALWDKNKKRLILARDRLGIKPLYFSINNNRVIFGSEIKCLLPFPDCPKEFDWGKAMAYDFHQTPSNYSLTSFFKGIEYLKGGQFISIDSNTGILEKNSYWDINRFVNVSQQDNRSQKEIIEGYKYLLEDSVSLRLMADVELGLFLSGGIDSVAIAKLASGYQKIPTFSVMSQSTFMNGDSESSHYLSRILDLENYQVVFANLGAQLDAAYWKNLLWTLETPLCYAEHLYKFELHRFAKRKFPKLKVILSGQGSDEFNGGYSTLYFNEDIHHDDNKWNDFLNILDKMEKESLMSSCNDLKNFSSLINKDFLAERINRSLFLDPWHFHINMYSYSLQMYNLWHEDRTASANNIENRVPFLDHRLVEYTLNIPPKWRKELFWDKQILRLAFEKELPPRLTKRTKKAFFYGKDAHYTNLLMYNLLIKDDKALLNEALGEKGEKHTILDRNKIELWVNQISETKNYSSVEALFRLVNMGLLERMVKHNNFKKNEYHNPLIIDELNVKDWEKGKIEIAEKLSLNHYDLRIDKPIKFYNNISLLTDQNNDLQIAVNDILEYTIEQKSAAYWYDFLKCIDGKKSINEILLELNINLSEIMSELKECLELKILRL